MSSSQATAAFPLPMTERAAREDRRDPPPTTRRSRRAMAGRAVRADDPPFRRARAGDAPRHPARACLFRGAGHAEVRTRVLRHRCLESGDEQFGALVPIFGTLVTSAIALLIGVPVSFGIAVFLTGDCAPPWLRTVLSAPRPRAACGDPEDHLRHVGPVRFRPFFADHVQPAMIEDLGAVWLVGPLFRALRRHRHLAGGHHSFGDGGSVHLLGDARRVREWSRRC